jgi:hypothetical protein
MTVQEVPPALIAHERVTRRETHAKAEAHADGETAAPHESRNGLRVISRARSDQVAFKSKPTSMAGGTGPVENDPAAVDGASTIPNVFVI